MSYAEFKQRVDKVIKAETDGLAANDFADADWMGLFESTGGHASNRQIIDLLAEADSMFAGILNAQSTGKPAIVTMESIIAGNIDLHETAAAELGDIAKPEPKTITVEITETQVRRVEIKAASPQDALIEAERAYKNEDIVLDDDDYLDTKFQVIIQGAP